MAVGHLLLLPSAPCQNVSLKGSKSVIIYVTALKSECCGGCEKTVGKEEFREPLLFSASFRTETVLMNLTKGGTQCSQLEVRFKVLLV